MVAGLPESTVIFGELRRSVPCFCESAEIRALTLKLPMMPVMFATGDALPASETPPGMVGALNGTVWLPAVVEVVRFDEALVAVVVPPTIWMPETLLIWVNASERERVTPLVP